MPPRIAFGPAEQQMVIEAVGYYGDRRADPAYEGHFEQLYTSAFAATMGGGYVDAVATGTCALFVAVASLHLPTGGEVLVFSYY